MRRNPFAIWSAWYNRRPFATEAVTVSVAVGTFIAAADVTFAPAANWSTIPHMIFFAVGAGLVSGLVGRLGAYLRRRGPAPRQPGDA